MRFETGLLRSRVSRRVLGLFIAAALLPLALSGWLSSTVVGDLVDRTGQQGLTQGTRQLALQVFDRLLAAKSLLATWPQAVPLGDGQALPPSMPGYGRVFQRVAHLDGNGHLSWGLGFAADLPGAWKAARGSATNGSAPVPRSAGETAAWLRVAPTVSGKAMRVLLAVGADPDQPSWLVELNEDYLWAPLIDAAAGTGWRVTDLASRTLRVEGEPELVPEPATPAGRDIGQAGTPRQVARYRMFLGGEFGASDWQFIQRKDTAEALLFGLPLGRWLVLVALSSVLLVAVISVGQIRRTLVPLEQLADGTRRLARGDAGARVTIRGNDEFSALAMSFNDMAERIDAQFRALEGLACIDRDILAGVPIDRVVERVLAQLAVLYPRATLAVVWLSGPARTDLACMRRPPKEGDEGSQGEGAAPASRLQLRPPQPLTPEQWQAFSSLTQDDVRPRRAHADHPWCKAARGPAVTHLALLPLRWIESTRAMVVLGLTETPTPAALHAATELRDRLAVAFAAREREQQLVHRAVHDSLTGLANRHGLHDQLDQWLQPAAGGPVNPCAVMFIDLDHFKTINDSLGHEAGDELLRLAADRLSACAGPGALVARPGGDEFVLALPGASETQARLVAADAVRRLSLPFVLRGREHVLGASVGLALAPVHGQSRAELLRHADMAMYVAKGKGRGQYAVFEETLDAQARERLDLQAELRRALAKGELIAHYQPRVKPGNGAITSAEALVRWQHPERGLLMPGQFIALAEESNLIEGIGERMLDLACAQMAQWRREGLRLRRVSVNVSPRQLASGRLLADVRAALARHELPASVLELEVTESLLVGDARDACAQLAKLRRWGVTIALDDFGTGYSSMATLRQLPIDVMKVDRAFVKDLGVDDSALSVTRAIVALAQSMKLHIVAEGMETEAQAAVLRDLGCHEFQGFLYSRPLSPEAFRALPGLSWAKPSLAPDAQREPSGGDVAEGADKRIVRA